MYFYCAATISICIGLENEAREAKKRSTKERRGKKDGCLTLLAKYPHFPRTLKRTLRIFCQQGLFKNHNLGIQ